MNLTTAAKIRKKLESRSFYRIFFDFFLCFRPLVSLTTYRYSSCTIATAACLL